jgi:type III secretion protein L
MSNNLVKQPLLPDRAAAASAIVKRTYLDAKAEAKRILAEARAEAQALVQSAETYAREAREAAYQQGREEALQELTEGLIATREARDKALASVEKDILKLAVKIAEKLIGREMKHDRQTMADLVAQALHQARRSEMVTLRVNPADLALVDEQRERLNPGGRVRYLDFIADPGVSPKGCLIATDKGAIDASLDTQLRVLERALLSLAEAGNEPIEN